MKISDILQNWTPAKLWESKFRTFTTDKLALAQIKIGRESNDEGTYYRSAHATRDTFLAPNGRYYRVTIQEVTVSDAELRREIAELTEGLNDV